MVSIIIPCYNCEGFINRAIDSVLNQTFNDWELLLVNNNSTDNTQQVLELCQSKNPERIFVFQESKKGAPAARNKGLQNAKGKWVQYLDADDELLSDKIEKQLTLAKENKADCVIGNAVLVEKKGEKIVKSVRRLYTADIWIGLTTSQLGITSAILWKKEILDKINGWNEQLTSSQEYDLMFRMLKAGGKVIFDESTNTLIYKTDSSISKNPDQSKMLRILDNRVNLRIQIFEYLKQTDQLTKEREAMIHRYIYQELAGNSINVKEYQSEKLKGFSINVPYNLRLNTYWNDTVRLLKGNIKSLIKSNKASK
jgi:glycosyltransferase involved in cell wall biosynthesis